MIAHLVKETVRFKKKYRAIVLFVQLAPFQKKIKKFSPDEVTSQQIFGFYI